MWYVILIDFRIFIFFNVSYLFLRERERACAHKLGRAEGEGDTESETDSRFKADITEPDTGLELTNCEIMT